MIERVKGTQTQKKRRQRRQRKVRYLRRRLAETKDFMERQRLIEKIRKISPRAPVPEQ